jgi:pentatricopeptide repeat protein
MNMHDLNLISSEVDLMVRMGVRPDVILYNTLIDGYCKAGRIDDAIRLFLQMLSNAVTPGIITYSTILPGYFSLGDVQAKELYLNMIKSGAQLDIYITI